MKKMKKPFRWMLYLLPVELFALLYFVLTLYYMNTFSLGIWINGIYCTGKSVEEVNELLCENTVLSDIPVTDAEGREEKISLEQAGCSVDYEKLLQELWEEQNPFFWVTGLFAREQIKLEPIIEYDDTMLLSQINELPVVKEGKNAGTPKVFIQKTDNGYVLIENLYHIPDADKIIEQILQEVKDGQESITISEECYVDRPLTAEMKETLALWKKVEELQNCQIVYDMGDTQVPIDAAVAAEWIAVDEDGKILTEDGAPFLKEDCFKEYIASLAEEFDTYNVPREFLSTRGDVITIEKGNYGNQLDRKAEEAYLKEAFEERRKEVHTPSYTQEALYKGKNDIGDTYIEIDMTNQTMYYYVDGKIEIETPIVTGNLSNGHKTPARVCYVYFMQRNRVLRGPDYASPVKYWIAVYEKIGIHDASWKKEYGGDIYKTNGSRGCINTPLEAVAKLYEMVEVGTPVIMYY